MELKNQFIIPADVPEHKHDIFTKNYNAITRNTGRLFLFSCDHKIEHLNTDFYGKSIAPQALHPEHMFRIASQGNVGAMATHLGLMARYAKQYPDINYIVKLNGKTNSDNPSILFEANSDFAKASSDTSGRAEEKKDLQKESSPSPFALSLSK